MSEPKKIKLSVYNEQVCKTWAEIATRQKSALYFCIAQNAETLENHVYMTNEAEDIVPMLKYMVHTLNLEITKRDGEK